MAKANATLPRTEGQVQEYWGFLSRKSGLLQGWDRQQYEIKLTRVGSQRTYHLRQLTGNKDNLLSVAFKKCFASTCDPRKNNNVKQFLSILLLFDDNPEVHHFQTDSVQEEREWLICLGASGAGLFSQDVPQDSQNSLDGWVGKWDKIHHSISCEQNEEVRVEESNGGVDSPPPAYDNVIGSMVASIEQAMYTHQMEHLNIEPVRPDLPSFLNTRRPVNDTYLPPYGPALKRPVSKGYGAEVRLPENVQQVWDPGSKRNVYINHTTKGVTWVDPRPLQFPDEVVSMMVTDAEHVRQRLEPLPGALTTHAKLGEIAEYAAKKPVGLRINGFGHGGAMGANGLFTQRQSMPGVMGKTGTSGANRSDNGWPGSTGGKGPTGETGAKGFEGKQGASLDLMLEGEPHYLQVTGDVVCSCDLGGIRAEYIVAVSCRGGRGGTGGRGGRGGEGGKGGLGGAGMKGKSRHGDGEKGCNGGIGGDGGRGGPGGDGGRGGQGGTAGPGGHVQVFAYDPRLFMLCEIDVRAGDPGKGGKGGEGGSHGRGGEGGEGGDGGYGPGGRGDKGGRGNHGPMGVYGSTGEFGMRGKNSSFGSILWQVLDPATHSRIETGGRRYELIVQEYEVVSELADDVFEPNERIFVGNVVVKNIGELNCPEGAEISFEGTTSMNTTTSVNFLPQKIKLPKIAPMEVFYVTDRFTGRISDMASPNKPGPFTGGAEIMSVVKLLNRPFLTGSAKQALCVEYPVKVAGIKVPHQMGRGEEKKMYIILENISKVPYGEGPDSGGFVDLRVRLDRRLFPVPAKDVNQPWIFNIKSGHVDGVSAKILQILPKGKIEVCLPLSLDTKAELFDDCVIEVDLYLRGKLIEYNHVTIKISPFFIRQDPPADILFIAGPDVNRQKFIFWQMMFDWLNITLDFWDTERYNGASLDVVTGKRHDTLDGQSTWVDHYRGRTIICCKIKMAEVLGKDIKSHFYSTNTDCHSAMICMPEGQGWTHHDNAVKTMNKQLVLDELDVNCADKFSGTVLLSRSPMEQNDCAKKKISDIIKSLEKDDCKNSYVLPRKDIKFQKKGGLKYSYGSLVVKRVPLGHAAEFYLVSSKRLSDLNLDNPKLCPLTTDVPIGSDFAQIMLYIILSAPPKVRTNMMKECDSSEALFQMLTPGGTRYSVRQLAALSLERYVCTEAVSHKQSPDRLEAVVTEICDNCDVYAKEDVAIHTHVAMQSYLSKIKSCSDAYRQKADALNERFKKAYVYVLHQGQQTEVEKGAKRMLKDKDRVTFDALINEHIFLTPHRCTHKDNLYDLEAH